MEYGSKEWLDKVNEQVDFPAMVAFYVSNLGKTYSRVIKTKATSVLNLKYENIQPALMLGEEDEANKITEVTALVTIKRLEDADDYLKVSKQIKRDWGIS